MLFGLGLVALGASAASAAAQGLDVYVGYADNVHTAAATFPTPFGPGAGITYQGCTPVSGAGRCAFDGGAVRLVNTGFSPISVDSTTVDFGGCVFDMWAHGTTIPGGGQLILAQQLSGDGNGCTLGTQTAPATMDSSDIGPGGAPWSGNCSESGVIPTVTVSVGGTPTTYTDSGQILNTGGFDAGLCRGLNTPGPSRNEASQWTLIGSPPCPTASLTLSPPSQTDAIGTSATVTAHLANSCGQPLSGVTVAFTGTGPNAPISGSGTTDLSGDAQFSYAGTHTGTDTLKSSVTNLGGTIGSNSVSVTWGNLGRNGTFSCRASAVKLLGLLELVVANGRDTPCKSASKSLLGLPPLIGVVNAKTVLTAGKLPVAGDNATASASAAKVSILGVPGHSIGVGAVSSQAKIACVPDGSGGLTTATTSSSNVASITIDGQTLTIGSAPAKLTIAGLATVWLNRTIVTGTTVDQRAVEVDLLGNPIAIVADSKVNSEGSPCATAITP